jgi:hypothetical protein
MLDALSVVGSVAAAAEILAHDYAMSLTDVGADLCEFCESMLERGLLVRA